MAAWLIENVVWLIGGVVALVIGIKIVVVRLFQRLAADSEGAADDSGES